MIISWHIEHYEITITESRPVTSKRKADDPICEICKAILTPQWRRGPNGKNTLCNACGLKWSKLQAKNNKTKTLEKMKIANLLALDHADSLPKLGNVKRDMK